MKYLTIILLISIYAFGIVNSLSMIACSNPNEEYQSCAPDGYQKCDESDNYPVCKPNCYCKYGYVRNWKNECVLSSQLCKVCYDDETFSDIPTASETNCDGTVSTSPPNSNCYCKSGLVRDTDGYCVPKADCLVQTPVCPLNEEYTSCGTACPLTCSNQQPRACILLCVQGCFCKTGYIRNDDGVCVLQSQCPTNKCPAGEEYKTCGTACPLTCLKPVAGICTKNCVRGCFCKTGLVRNAAGKCVALSQCPKAPSSQCKLDPTNEVYTDCGSACPLTCDKPNERPCTRQCVPGCYCKAGLVRDRFGKCVAVSKCSLTEGMECPANEYFTACKAQCPSTCANPTPLICPASCRAGCLCIPPLVRSSTGSCITQGRCA